MLSVVVLTAITNPGPIVMGPDGNLYVAYGLSSIGNNRCAIAQVTPSGVVTNFAGNNTTAGTTDGTGSSARFRRIFGLTWASDGNLYVCDNFAIRKITSGAVVTTFAGLVDIPGYVNNTGGIARFQFVVGITDDGAGNLYICDSTTNYVIRKVTYPGAVVTLLCGNQGVQGSNDGTGSGASFFLPGAITFAAGNLYINDLLASPRIRKSTLTGIVTTLTLSGINLSSTGFISLTYNPITGLIYGSDGSVGNAGPYYINLAGLATLFINPTQIFAYIGIALDINGTNIYLSESGAFFNTDIYKVISVNNYSGLYKLSNITHDTLLNGGFPGNPPTPVNVKIPNPLFKTGYIGG